MMYIVIIYRYRIWGNIYCSSGFSWFIFEYFVYVKSIIFSFRVVYYFVFVRDVIFGDVNRRVVIVIFDLF